ncbi:MULTISPECIES: reverse transcriptase N-terminal domain-containing protein [Streptomyces]|uniref:reverse transcriptase N-terminal domain-containing protein n=1 Tax=Streptomyces TaxID=1883 RepID=UPI00359F57FE
MNGPEDEITDWLAVDWQQVEDDVRRLRQRIFTASPAGDLKRVRNLQKLMLRSRANTLLSVRRVTEINAGRTTAGIDGKVVLLRQGSTEPSSGPGACPAGSAGQALKPSVEALPSLERGVIVAKAS